MEFYRLSPEERGFDLYRPWLVQTKDRFHISEDELFILVDGFLLGVPFSELAIRSGVNRAVILGIYNAGWIRAVLYRKNFRY